MPLENNMNELTIEEHPPRKALQKPRKNQNTFIEDGFNR